MTTPASPDPRYASQPTVPGKNKSGRRGVAGWLADHEKTINILGVISVLVAVGRTFGLQWTEPLPWMSEAGELAYDASLAWATAWAFQLLVIVVPAEKERRRFDNIVAPRLDALIDLGLDLEASLEKKASKDGQSRAGLAVDVEVIAKACHLASLSEEASGWDLTWGELLEHIGDQAEDARSALRPFYPRFSLDVLEALEAEEVAMKHLLTAARVAPATHAGAMKRIATEVFVWLSSVHMILAVREQAVATWRPVPHKQPVVEGYVRTPLDKFLTERTSINEALVEFRKLVEQDDDQVGSSEATPGA